jgi:hypothetical protein
MHVSSLYTPVVYEPGRLFHVPAIDKISHRELFSRVCGESLLRDLESFPQYVEIVEQAKKLSLLPQNTEELDSALRSRLQKGTCYGQVFSYFFQYKNA